MFKKSFCILFASILIISSLASCVTTPGSTATSGTAATDASTTTAAPESTAPPLFNKTGLPIVNQPVTIDFMLRRSNNSKNDFKDKDIVKEGMRETGIDFNFIEIQSAAWEEHVNIVLASNDLPDVLNGFIPNYAQNVGAFRPLNDLIDEYSPTFKKYLEEYESVRTALPFPNGNIYSLPNTVFDPANNYRGLVVNISWLDQLNMPVPTTLDELYEMLKAFKEKNPSGRQNIIPLSFVEKSTYDLSTMLWNFGLNNDDSTTMTGTGKSVMMENGKVVFIPSDPRYFDFLTYMHKLYAEGLVDPDGFIQKQTDFLAKAKTGVFGLFADTQVGQTVVGPEFENEYTYMLPVKDPTGKITTINRKMEGDFSVDRFSVTVKCENPEIPVLFWEDVNSDFFRKVRWNWGEEGVTWKRIDGDKAERLSKVPDEYASLYASYPEARFTTGVAGAGFFFWSVEDANRFITPGENRGISLQLERVTAYEPYFKKEFIPVGQDTEEVSKRKLELWGEIDTYLQNFLADSVINGITEAQWQTHLNNCEKLNVAEFVQIYQDYCDRMNNLK